MFRTSIAVAFAVVSGGVTLAGCSSQPDDAPTKPVGTPPDAGGGDDAAGDADASSTLPTLIIEPDQGMTPIYAFVGTAKKTLDMTMYELTDTTFTGLLTQAAKNGVTVRVILDQNLEMTDNTTAYDALGAANVQVHWANPTFQASHQKTITVDGTTSAIMTLNLASDDYATSRDFAVITDDVADVAAIEAVFNADFTNAAVSPPTGDDLVWSPTNAQPALLALINGAKTSLLVENEEMGDAAIVAALSAAAVRGIDVKVVMENSRSYATEFTKLVTTGVKLVTYSRSGLYIHAKVILADYGTSSAQVFIGSENFSNPSLTENRELGLVTTNEGIMASISTTLTSDYAGGRAYQPADAGAMQADAGGASPEAGGAETSVPEAGASD